MRSFAVIAVSITLFGGIRPVAGQQLAPQTWHAMLETSSGDPEEVRVILHGTIDMPGITLEPPSRYFDDRLQAERFEVTGRQVSFRLPLDAPLTCTLDMDPGIGYQGLCQSDGIEAMRMSLMPPLVGMLLPAHEAVLARSAAPDHLADGAGVHVMTASGLREAAASTNGFTCFIERRRPDDLWPICHSTEAARHLLPVEVLRGMLRAGGETEGAIRDSVAAAYRDGRFTHPERPAIGYMLSHHGYSLSPETGELRPLGPHMHLYVPYATESDLGFVDDSGQRKLGLGVGDRGQPNASIALQWHGDTLPQDRARRSFIDPPSRETPDSAAAVGSARRWLQLLAEGRLAESLDRADPLLQEMAGGADAWQRFLAQARGVPPARAARTLIAYDARFEAPAAPPGRYVQLVFEAPVGPRMVRETVVLRPGAEVWRVAIYQVHRSE